MISAAPVMPALSTLTHKGMDIRYGIWGKALYSAAERPNKPILVVLPGLSEFIEKYALIMLPLLEQDVDALIIDCPSQGMSGRLLAERLPVHIGNFNDYLDALEAVLNATGILRGRPVILFGHSMGGHLALRALKHIPDLDIKGIVLSAPMMQLALSPSWFIRPALQVLMMLGFAKKPVSAKHNRPDGNTFYDDNPLTTDADGYAVMPQLWQRYPMAKTYEPTYGWVKAAYQSCARTTASTSWLHHLSCPMQAHIPADERIVDGKIQKWAVDQIPQCESHIYPAARHELMLERPEIRQLFWHNVMQFLKRLDALPDTCSDIVLE